MLLLFAGVALAAPGAGPPRAGPCVAEPLRTTGTVYYYCDCQAGAAAGCVAGNDANGGTSAAAPRQSFANAASRFGSMNAGDTVAFCRGGAWSTTGATWANPACRAGTTCDVRDYVPSWGSASSARPLIVASSGDTFNMNRNGHEEGYRFLNLDVRGGRWGFFLYSDVGEVEICDVNIDGTQIAVHQGGGATGQARNGRLTIRDSTISRSSNQGILAGANDLSIVGNTFVDNGVAGTFNHAVYIEGETIPGSSPQDAYETFRVKIANNRITQTSSCGGVIIVAHGRQNGLTIENNLVEAPAGSAGCYGISVGHGNYPYGCWYRSTSILRNRVILGAGRVGIALDSSVDAAITDNLVVLAARYADGILVAGEPRLAAGAANTRTAIQNNTVRLTAAHVNAGIRLRPEGEGHVVENNAVFLDEARAPCLELDGSIVRRGHDFCRRAGGAPIEDVWTAAPQGDYTPAKGGPLDGKGDPLHFSPVAIGTATWSPRDAGVPRRAPVDVGALRR